MTKSCEPSRCQNIVSVMSANFDGRFVGGHFECQYELPRARPHSPCSQRSRFAVFDTVVNQVESSL